MGTNVHPLNLGKGGKRRNPFLRWRKRGDPEGSDARGRAPDEVSRGAATSKAVLTPGQDALPELVIGLVSPVGTSLSQVAQAVAASLKRFGYATAIQLRVSEGFMLLPTPPWSLLPKRSAVAVAAGYGAYMEAGDELRRKLARYDAAMLPALLRIAQERTAIANDPTASTPLVNTCLIVDSLKTPSEIDLLRAVYGDRFLVISAYAPRETRVDSLERLIVESPISQAERPQAKALAETTVARDERGRDQDLFGQDVTNAFPRADLFVDVRYDVSKEIDRFFDLLFGSPFQTPTPMEQGMFLAHTAALRSGSLARQVGAAITTRDGQVIALGTNETPKPGGGAYWCTDDPDLRTMRTITQHPDPSDRIRADLILDTMLKLEASGWRPPPSVNPVNTDWVTTAAHEFSVWQADGAAVGKRRSLLLDASIEFYREVHAEMLAVTDAARRGVSVSGMLLFATTFPCHLCAKNLLASGIDQIIYLEPYPKSRVTDLYHDEIALDPPERREGVLNLQPFVGVAPRLYQTLFRSPNRQSRLDWPKEAILRLYDYDVSAAELGMEHFDVPGSINREQAVLLVLSNAFTRVTGVPI